MDKLSKLRKWIIPSVVLEEFSLVLIQLRVNENSIKEKILEILLGEKTELVAITRQHFLDAIEIVSKEKTSLKRLNDKLIISVAKAKKLPIFTYDREIKTQWHKII